MKEHIRVPRVRGGRAVPRAGALLLAGLLSACLCAGCGPAEERRERAAAVRMSDFLLDLQEENGAIPDAADADSVNEDSNMEYALVALAAAYQSTGQEKYLSGLERGIAWLADAEERDSGLWRGSWWYRYDRDGRPLPSPGENGVADVRGVDATSALFVYLLYLHERCAGTRAFADGYRENAAAALDFLLARSRTEEGFMASSFQKDGAGRWSRYDCCYAADQGDVWLGLRAGALLYGRDDCARAAAFLKENVPAAFFSETHRRYCTALADGRQDWSEEGFAPVQSQGFLPWLWGGTGPNRAAVGWLRERLSGELSAEFYLSAAFLRLGEQGIGAPHSDRIGAWLIGEGMDEKTGGVYDSPRDRTETINAAAFCALALFGWSAGL